MKILQIHNKYQLEGGEDVVVENEKKLLESKGHLVLQYLKDNKEINNYSLLEKASLSNSIVWSKESYSELKEIINIVKPDICHVHNYMPIISPAIFYACKEMKIPVVQTLHNYRMLCSNASLFRNGNICEECIGKSLYHGLKYGCYRNSRIQTFILARMIEQNKTRGTFQHVVDGYICPSNFAREKFIEGNLQKEKLFLKPNFLFEDTGYSENDAGYFFYAGRLDETKGVNVLIEAASKLPNVQFKVAGDGPLKEKVIGVLNIEYLGQLKKIEMIKYLKNSCALIFPSIWYETFGLTIIEGFACGKPVIGSNLGAIKELIENKRTGLLFEPGNADDLVEKINWVLAYKVALKQIGKNARKEFEEKYTGEKNYKMLMDVYLNIITNYKKNIYLFS